LVGPRTIGAIERYQAGFMRRPDGRVDPGGATLRRLDGASTGAPAPHTPPNAGAATGAGAVTSTGGAAAAADASFYPPRPSFPPLNLQGIQGLFGQFAYVHAPTANDREAIRITDNWPARNIQRVAIPQLAGVATYGGRRSGGTVPFHRLAVPQLQALWAAWESAGLIDRVIFYGGSWVPRFKRRSACASDSDLSNHAWGTAFDINPSQNGLGAQPARMGQTGCVLELVAIANEHGFFWGGHFTRRDGMHFEIGRIQ
jgi:hypothetical protein